MLDERPYVLKGTKALAVDFDKLRLPTSKKVWIVSADIVAYYPNIPTKRCIDRIIDWYTKWAGDKGAEPAELHMFARCCRLANSDLYLEFNGECYKQIKGIAMGIACSPDLANLWAAYDEEAIVPAIPEILFFRRYIDDILAFVQAETRDEALAIAQQLEYDSVELTWECSDIHMPFLDMSISIDPVSRQVVTKPFRKAFNHLERIPFGSHHPMDVKKGTFIGEMSRLAALCNSPELYIEAIKDLQLLYIARGYPTDLVSSWTKINLAKRWDQRLKNNKQDIARDNSQSLMVLKSTFNPVWVSFNIQELAETIHNTWRLKIQEIERDELLSFAEAPRPKWVHGRYVVAWTQTFDAGVQDYEGGEIPLPPTPVFADSLPDTDPRRWGPFPAPQPASFGGPDLEEAEARRAAYNADLADTALIRVPEGVRLANRSGREVKLRLNISKTKLENSRWLVSRKRNTNLFDIVSLWKKSQIKTFLDRNPEEP